MFIILNNYLLFSKIRKHSILILQMLSGRENDALFEDKVKHCKKCKTNGLLAIDTCVKLDACARNKLFLLFLGYGQICLD